MPYPVFNACGLHEVYESPTNILDDKILSIQGVFIGLVEQTTDSIIGASNDTDLNNVFRQAHELAISKSGIIEEDFLRTIFMDRSMEHDCTGNRWKNEMPSEHLIAARTWLHWLLSLENGDNLDASSNAISGSKHSMKITDSSPPILARLALLVRVFARAIKSTLSREVLRHLFFDLAKWPLRNL